ncbi:hypothetical protein GTR02_10915 [Kineococcus sp. R8]|uniref:hypothetical protein n=1 Tax=Kineococcus siccus TaxID=2696567 RepID=UPI0014124727|nr:hypothetical protein [Kineococcus siccus]NAZ82329.1 hypothetical protein [Kineococcus siccus]
MMTGVGPWNSLEVTRLIVEASIPVVLLLLGVWVAAATRRVEAAQESTRAIIARRVELHREMAPLLNDLHCFFRCVGHFRSISPPEAVQLKRDLDRLFFTNQYLFSAALQTSYEEFIRARFATWGGAGVDALLRMRPEHLRHERGAGHAWDSSWDERFSDEVPDGGRQATSYVTISRAFAHDLGVSDKEMPPLSVG